MLLHSFFKLSFFFFFFLLRLFYVEGGGGAVRHLKLRSWSLSHTEGVCVGRMPPFPFPSHARLLPRKRSRSALVFVFSFTTFLYFFLLLFVVYFKCRFAVGVSRKKSGGGGRERGGGSPPLPPVVGHVPISRERVEGRKGREGGWGVVLGKGREGKGMNFLTSNTSAAFEWEWVGGGWWWRGGVGWGGGDKECRQTLSCDGHTCVGTFDKRSTANRTRPADTVMRWTSMIRCGTTRREAERECWGGGGGRGMVIPRRRTDESKGHYVRVFLSFLLVLVMIFFCWNCFFVVVVVVAFFVVVF